MTITDKETFVKHINQYITLLEENKSEIVKIELDDDRTLILSEETHQ